MTSNGTEGETETCSVKADVSICENGLSHVRIHTVVIYDFDKTEAGQRESACLKLCFCLFTSPNSILSQNLCPHNSYCLSYS